MWSNKEIDLRLFRTPRKTSVLLFCCMTSTLCFGQEDTGPVQDSAKVVVSIQTADSKMEQDTAVQKREDSRLDITQDRGLYILAEENKLQLRILGSVRFSAFYENKNLNNKNVFSTFEIPTGAKDINIPNYYNSLSFSRLGFEVTRKTLNGNIFIRLETDFAGPGNTFRIRHAYGQYGRWLIGQTWSLLTNASSLPATVDPGGPTGAISSRTPQIRYSLKISERFGFSAAFEYSLPDYASPDSLQITFVQTIPNLTARINREGKYGSFQLGGIFAPIAGYDPDGNKNNSFGYGTSLSGTFELKHSDEILFQGTFGRAISHFINPFQGQGQDMAYDPQTAEFKGLTSAGGFVSYGHHWPRNISSYFSFGMSSIINNSLQVGDDFDYSYSFSGNAFWKIVEGLRIGVEYMYGQRFNIDHSNGNANRTWILFYYDF
ncbi:MAG: DcaP family trimeric outer membrane transporter [Cyclobacteriaceae bacterium]|nr:DcaP family trimeric outer membrane transporter [Cyclobacteriaceae bacterium]MDH5250194.1 DcaP family trimeric outer membrane transporter [Cyclobacteriaceae bacterium]